MATYSALPCQRVAESTCNTHHALPTQPLHKGGDELVVVIAMTELSKPSVAPREKLACIGHRHRMVAPRGHGYDVSPQQQGLTLVRFSAQLEPCLTQTKHSTHPLAPTKMGFTTPKRNPFPIKSAQVELRSERV